MRNGITEEVAERYLTLAGEGDADGAAAIVTGLLDDGVPAQRVLLDVIAATQRRVGALWAANAWTVAQEHTATAISEHVLALVARRSPVAVRRGPIAVACVDGEWHSLPVRILAEMLRLDGWEVDYLGPDVSGARLVGHLHQHDAESLALSCMIAARLPKAHAAITACRAAGVAVIAGGPGFGEHGRYARRLGADAWAYDAEHAVARLGNAWPPSVEPATPAVLGGDEYTRVTRHRHDLVAAVLDALAVTAEARDRSGEDVSTTVDYLSAALYVDDADLFSGYAGWTATVQAARPPAPIAAGEILDGLAARLRDYPRTLGMLAAGREAVKRAAPSGAG
jgi:methanogenic corrinoid protein MtbC1